MVDHSSVRILSQFAWTMLFMNNLLHFLADLGPYNSRLNQSGVRCCYMFLWSQSVFTWTMLQISIKTNNLIVDWKQAAYNWLNIVFSSIPIIDDVAKKNDSTRYNMRHLNFKTCHQLLGNIWKWELSLIEHCISLKIEDEEEIHKKKKKNLSERKSKQYALISNRARFVEPYTSLVKVDPMLSHPGPIATSWCLVVEWQHV